jgi:hypothetical protein
MKPTADVRTLDSLAFQLMCEYGRMLVAAYGDGDVPWSDVRDKLRANAARFGLEDAERRRQLARQVVELLRSQLAELRRAAPPRTPSIH